MSSTLHEFDPAISTGFNFGLQFGKEDDGDIQLVMLLPEVAPTPMSALELGKSLGAVMLSKKENDV